MRSRFITVFLVTLLLLGTIYASSAQAGDGGGKDGDAGYTQTPVQTIVQIAVTAIILRILNYFDLP